MAKRKVIVGRISKKRFYHVYFGTHRGRKVVIARDNRGRILSERVRSPRRSLEQYASLFKTHGSFAKDKDVHYFSGEGAYLKETTLYGKHREAPKKATRRQYVISFDYEGHKLGARSNAAASSTPISELEDEAWKRFEGNFALFMYGDYGHDLSANDWQLIRSRAREGVVFYG